MNRKIIYVAATLLLTLKFIHGQSIPIQLMVVDQNGFEMPNTQVNLRLTMRGDTSLTTGQYQEVHNVSTNDLGVVSVDLGEGIVTTNSQVLAIDLFSFGIDEPYIKTELDTSISPANYTNLGWMRYRYPMIARRALWADSSNTALVSISSYSSVISDSSKYLINEKEEWYLDSSRTNEVQSLYMNNGYLKLSLSSDSIEFNTAAGLNKTEDYCHYSEEYYSADSGIIDVAIINDTTYILKQTNQTNDSTYYRIEKKTTSTINMIAFQAPNTKSYGRLLVRKNRLLIIGSDILVYSGVGNLVFSQILNNSNRLIAIGDTTIFLTNSYSGTSFTISFKDIYSGSTLSAYQNVCSGCVSRPLPTLGITSGDTAWINAYNGNEPWMCYNGNLYSQSSSAYKSKPKVFDIETNHSRFTISQTGLFTITDLNNSKVTGLPVDQYYFLTQTNFSLLEDQDYIICRYIANSSHMLFNRYAIELPAYSGNVLIELAFDAYGVLKSVSKSLVIELRVDEISYSSILRIPSSACLNGQNINSSAILSR
jgi:hypothetical protein